MMEENNLPNNPLDDLPEMAAENDDMSIELTELEQELAKLADEPVGVTFSLESVLYILAVLAALVFRLVALGSLPLSESEAEYAWQAYQISHAEPIMMLSHPAYLVLTGGLFALLGSGEVLARFLPALVGSAVVALPFVFRRQLGPRAALVAAFGLAIDPLLVAYSRQAGSPVMALGFAALALWMWQERKMFLAGVFAALMLLSGPGAVLGLLTIVLGAVGLYLVNRRKLPIDFSAIFGDKRFLAGAGIALVFIGTAFMRYPQGLAAMLQAIPDYFTTWGADGGSPLMRSLAALAVYSPLALLFGLIAVSNLDTWLEDRSKIFGFWLLAAMVFALANPGRQISDLLWGIVPLWLLAVPLISKYLRMPERSNRDMVWVAGSFFMALLLYWQFNIAATTQQSGMYFPEDFYLLNFQSLDQNTTLYLVRLIITVFIPVLILLLVGVIQLNWSGGAAFQAATWSVTAFLTVYLISAAFGFTDDRTEVAGELWTQGSSPGYIEEIRLAVEDVSLMTAGSINEVDMVYMLDAAQLHWAFRDFPNARYQPVLDTSEPPSIILNSDLTFGYSDKGRYYRGQLSVFNFHQSWGGASLPNDFDRWLVYRVSPVEKEWLAIWTRADLFPYYEPLIEAQPLPLEVD